jgi:hypothetical protein
MTRRPFGFAALVTLSAVLVLSPSIAAQAAPGSAAPFQPGARLTASRFWYRGASAPQIVLPDGSHRSIRSLLDVKRPMTYGDYVWNEEGVPPGPLWIRVDIDAQLISVFRGEHEIGTAVILYGARAKPTPAGVFHVLQKAEHYVSHTYDAPMPYMLRLTRDGVAIHASSVREGWATHGCIGTPPEFAQRLFAQTKLGDIVSVASRDRS